MIDDSRVPMFAQKDWWSASHNGGRDRKRRPGHCRDVQPWQYGRYASGRKAPFAIDKDTPNEELNWWNDDRAHPNWIIPNAPEPLSRQLRWMGTVVSVSKA